MAQNLRCIIWMDGSNPGNRPEMGEIVASGLTQEIKNSLHSIITGLDILENRFKGMSPDTINTLKKESEKIDKVIKDFFFYSSPYSPDRTYCDINLLLQEILSIASHSKKDTYRRIFPRLALDLPKLFIDRGRIQQVFWDIIRFCCHFSHPGCDIAVHTYLRDGFVYIDIVGSRSRITEEQLHDMFIPFQFPGMGVSGLFLAVAEKIIKAHDGTIDIHHGPAGTTHLSIGLPFKAP